MVMMSGEPKSKQRPRFSRGHAYTPKETLEAEATVREAYLKAGGFLFEGQVKMELVFALSNRRRRDADNMAKLVMDALNKVAYHDDNQVIELTIKKVRSLKGWTFVYMEEAQEASYETPYKYWEEVKERCQSCS